MTTSIRPTPHRSAFAAAFLTFIFPGLGHLYAGAYKRAFVFAVLPLAIFAGVVVQFAHYGLRDFALWIAETSVLEPLAAANVAVLAYRVFVTVDAYRSALPAGPTSQADRGRRRFVPRLSPWSLAGVAAVLAMMAAGHVLAGYWDLRVLRMAVDTHTPIVIAAEAPSVTPGASTEPLPSPTLPVTATFQAQPTARPWDQKGRLNILLVGVDQQDGGFRTDTMIVASIDPTTHRVALFSMPRDTWGLPTPPGSALSLLWGPSLNFKLNALWTYSDPYRGLFPGGGADALKEAMSYALFGTPNAIPYYVLVSFSGFQDIIDTFGGVTINVPAPLVDNGFPGNGDGQHLRVNIPAGMQHMNGFEALTYARSRKGGGYYNDYDRSARQEQLLVALKQQADLSAISSHLSDLIDDLSSTIHTDIPEGPDVLGALIDQARFVNLVNIKTYAFSTSGYGEGAMVGPVDSQTSAFLPDLYTIRATVAAATSPAAKVAPKAVVTEQAPIVVEVGSGTAQQAADLVAYLQYLGLNAEVGAAQPGDDPTKMLVVDGADGVYPQTLAFLEQVLGLAGPVSTDGSTAVQASSQAGQQIEFVIILGANTPDITPPSS